MIRNSLLVLALVLVAGAGLLPFSGETRSERAVTGEPTGPAAPSALEPVAE